MRKKSKLIDQLKHEKTELEVRINATTYSDEDIATLEAFCATIKTKLNIATFADKRHILDLLDVRGTLAIENGERIIYVQCLIAPQPVSLVLTSHSLNTGATRTMICEFLPTGHFQ